MCGRTCLCLDKEQIRCAVSYKCKGQDTYTKPEWLHEHNNGKDYSPSYNIAPTDVTPVLVSGSKYKNATQAARVLKPMMWGMIPTWHKGDYRAHNLSTNNCRIETIKSSKLFNPILRNGGRCVVIAEGFYEWQTTDKTAKSKQPFYIYSPQSENLQVDQPHTWTNTYSETEGWQGMNLLYMAGLYNVWQNDNTIIYSYSIITMESNTTFNWLHHRIPAILSKDDQIQAWLNIDDVDVDVALSYLRPAPLLSWHKVASVVNSSRNKSDECNKKLRDTKNKTSQKLLTAWFQKPEKRPASNGIASDCKKLKH